MENIIKITNANLGYTNNPILKNINLEINKGEFLIVNGQNGSGKTLFVKFLFMKVLPIFGQYKLFDEIIDNTKKKLILKLRKKIGVILQYNFLIPYFTVRQNIQIAFEIQSGNMLSIDDRVNEMIAWVGLSKKTHYNVENLSDAEKQKVIIARSIVSNPQLLIADEPMLNLDDENRKKFLFLLRSINELGTTIILTTNKLEDFYKDDRKIFIKNKEIH